MNRTTPADNDTPTCTVSLDNNPYSNVTVVTATFDFSEPVVDFSLSSIYLVANGTGSSIGALTTVNTTRYLVPVYNGGVTGKVTIGIIDRTVHDNVGHGAPIANNSINFSTWSVQLYLLV